MIIETMYAKPITPEIHAFEFDGYTYTNYGEKYNLNDYIRPAVEKPCKCTYVAPEKIKLDNITVTSKEGLPQYIKSADDSINMKPLLEYDYITAIPFDVEVINKNISSARVQYSDVFLDAVQAGK